MRLLLRLPQLAVYSATCAALTACFDSEHPPAAPLISVAVPQTTIPYNQSASIVWHTTGGNRCVASEGWSGSLGASGELAIGPLVSDQQFELRCQGEGGATSQSVQLRVAPPELQFEVDRPQVAAGEGVVVAWNSNVSGSCFASSNPPGVWEGEVGAAGMRALSGLTSDSELSLTCRDGLHQVSKQIALAVQSQTLAETVETPQPVIRLTVSSNRVRRGGTVTLQWSGEHLEGCRATGDWSGEKGGVGIESVSAIQSDKQFGLRCHNAQGEVIVSQRVEVDGGTAVAGVVDSSLLPLHGEVELHVFSGGGYDADSAVQSRPLRRVALTQQACAWRYQTEALASGRYTLGLYDRVAKRYLDLRELSLTSGGDGANFLPRRVLRVGQDYPDLEQTLAVAQTGDVIEIEAGVFRDQLLKVTVPGVTLRGVGGLAHFVSASYQVAAGTAVGQVEADEVRLENVAFAGANAEDGSGVGLRTGGRSVAVCNGYFYDNDTGMDSASAQTQVTFSEFDHNREQLRVAGERLLLRGSYFHEPGVGAQLRSTSAINEIQFNQMIDGTRARTAHNLEFPKGGRATLLGNVIEKGPRAKSTTLITFGDESLDRTLVNRLALVNNTFVANITGAVVAFVQEGAGAVIANNVLAGTVSWVDGQANLRGNVIAPAWSFVNPDEYDFHLRSNSPAVDSATSAARVDGAPLSPQWEYQACCSLRPRPSDGALDAGAFEFR